MPQRHGTGRSQRRSHEKPTTWARNGSFHAGRGTGLQGTQGTGLLPAYDPSAPLVDPMNAVATTTAVAQMASWASIEGAPALSGTGLLPASGLPVGLGAPAVPSGKGAAKPWARYAGVRRHRMRRVRHVDAATVRKLVRSMRAAVWEGNVVAAGAVALASKCAARRIRVPIPAPVMERARTTRWRDTRTEADALARWTFRVVGAPLAMSATVKACAELYGTRRKAA